MGGTPPLPVRGETQNRFAEFCYCLCFCSNTHSFNFLLRRPKVKWNFLSTGKVWHKIWWPHKFGVNSILHVGFFEHLKSKRGLDNDFFWLSLQGVGVFCSFQDSNSSDRLECRLASRPCPCKSHTLSSTPEIIF